MGLLGGTSGDGAAVYRRLTDEVVRDRLGGLHPPLVIVVSPDVEDALGLQRDGSGDEAGRLLTAVARRAEDAGADLLLLCTGPDHAAAEQLADEGGLPLLCLAEVTAQAVRAAGLHAVGLLRTASDQQPWREQLESHGLTVLVPGEQDRARVHQGVEELRRGQVVPSSRAACAQAVGRLAAVGAQGVVLGCTELEMLLSPADAGLPLFPATRLHVEAAVALALPGTPRPRRPRLLPDLFHVAEAAQWEAGDYRASTRGLTLDDVGLVHLAFAWQVQGVLDRFYADADGPLLLLRVDPCLVSAPVRVEPSEGSPEGFPHLYGPLEPSAVVEQVPLARGAHCWQAPSALDLR